MLARCMSAFLLMSLHLVNYTSLAFATELQCSPPNSNPLKTNLISNSFKISYTYIKLHIIQNGIFI